MAGRASKVKRYKSKFIASRAKKLKELTNEVTLQKAYISDYAKFSGIAKDSKSWSKNQKVKGLPQYTFTPQQPRSRKTQSKKIGEDQWGNEIRSFARYEAFSYLSPQDIIGQKGGSTSVRATPSHERKFVNYREKGNRALPQTYRKIASNLKQSAFEAEMGKLADAQSALAAFDTTLEFDSSNIKGTGGDRMGAVYASNEKSGIGVSSAAGWGSATNTSGGAAGLATLNATNIDFSNTSYTEAKAYGELRDDSTPEERAKMDQSRQTDMRVAYAEKFGMDINQSYGSDKTKTTAEKKADAAKTAENTFASLYGSYANVRKPTETRTLPDSYYLLRGLQTPSSLAASTAASNEAQRKADEQAGYKANQYASQYVYTSLPSTAFGNNLVSFNAYGEINNSPDAGSIDMNMFKDASPEKQQEIQSSLIDIMVDERIDLDKTKIDTSLAELDASTAETNYQLGIERLAQHNRDIYGSQTGEGVMIEGTSYETRTMIDGMPAPATPKPMKLVEGQQSIYNDNVILTSPADLYSLESFNNLSSNSSTTNPETKTYEGTINQYFINSKNTGETKVVDGKVVRGELSDLKSSLRSEPMLDGTSFDRSLIAEKSSSVNMSEYDKVNTTSYSDLYGLSSSNSNISSIDGYESKHPELLKGSSAYSEQSAVGTFGSEYRAQSIASEKRISSLEDKRDADNKKRNTLLKDKKTIENALTSVGRNDYITNLYDSGAYDDIGMSGSLLTITKDPGRDRMINQIELYASEQKQSKADLRRIAKLQEDIDKLKSDKNKKSSSEYSTTVLSQQNKLKNEKKELENQLKNINNFKLSNTGLTKQEINKRNMQNKTETAKTYKDAQDKESKRLKEQITIKQNALKESKTQTKWQVRKDSLFERIGSILPSMPYAFADTGKKQTEEEIRESFEDATLYSMSGKLKQVSRAKSHQEVLLKDAKNALSLRLSSASTNEENVARANILNDTQKSKDEFEKLSGLDVSRLEEDGYNVSQISQMAFERMGESGLQSSGVLNKDGERRRSGGIDEGRTAWMDNWLQDGGSGLMRSADDIDLVLGRKTPDGGIKNKIQKEQKLLDKYDKWGSATSLIGDSISDWKFELKKTYGASYGTSDVADSEISKAWFGTANVEGESWGEIARRENPRTGTNIGADKHLGTIIEKAEKYQFTLANEIDVKKKELSLLRSQHAKKELLHKSLRPQIDIEIDKGVTDGKISANVAFAQKLETSSQELYDLKYSIAEHQVAQEYYEKSLSKTAIHIEKFKKEKRQREFEIVQSGTSSSGMINRIRRSGSYGGQQANRFRRNTGARNNKTRAGYQSLGGLVR